LLPSPALAATLLRCEGSQDGIRFGRAAWSDGARFNFSHDRLSGKIRIIQSRGNDGYLDVTEDAEARVPSLRAALALRERPA
jgi:hypothetical protein